MTWNRKCMIYSEICINRIPTWLYLMIRQVFNLHNKKCYTWLPLRLDFLVILVIQFCCLLSHLLVITIQELIDWQDWKHKIVQKGIIGIFFLKETLFSNVQMFSLALYNYWCQQKYCKFRTFSIFCDRKNCRMKVTIKTNFK